jgi:hypothetical protein
MGRGVGGEGMPWHGMLCMCVCARGRAFVYVCSMCTFMCGIYTYMCAACVRVYHVYLCIMRTYIMYTYVYVCVRIMCV